MIWKRCISTLVLGVVAAAPLLGTLCATRCESPATSASSIAEHHHGSVHHHSVSNGAAADTRIQDLPHHDCGSHDAALWQSTAAPDRADGLASLPASSDAATPAATIRASGPRSSHDRPLAATHPPAALVLRV